MGKTSYRRDHPDGTQEIFVNVLRRPNQIYYDDFLHNSERSEELSLQFVRFGKEQSYPKRTIKNRSSEDFILHYITDGKGSFNGTPLFRGDGFVTFPHMIHTLQADANDPWKFCWVCFRGRDAYAQLRNVGITPQRCIFRYGFFERMSAVFEELIYQTHEDADMDLYMTSRFYELLSYHRKEYLETAPIADAKYRYVSDAMEYMNSHLSEMLRMEQLADMLHISRKYLCRLFQVYLGISPKEYMLQKRMEEATYLLAHTDLALPEIARRVGYEDYTQLTRLFKSKLGMSPKQYREK